MFTFIKKLFIPKGFYCYTSLKIIIGKPFGFRIKTRTCPFYRSTSESLYGWCLLDEWEVVDQCKICGVKDNLGDDKIGGI